MTDISGSLPREARAVVVGSGIVGSSLAYHLTELGWSDVVLLDKGPLPNPGGSTGHASNFIFPVDHSKEMTLLTLDSIRQYRELDTFVESGGFEVARTEERMQELHRRVSSGRSWGVEGVAMATPAEIEARVPYVDATLLHGGFFTPSVGIVDPIRAGTLMRERGIASGRLSVFEGVEVVGVDVERGHVRRVRTTGGDVQAETVVIACGVWSPKLARMAGASIPLTPAVHQMIDVAPVPWFTSATVEIEFPIVRDMDAGMYERQRFDRLEIGSYAHRPILHDPDELPAVEDADPSPTEFPFTPDDFAAQLEDARELMPFLRDQSVQTLKAVNGILSFTPDGAPIIGETPEVRGLWSAAAVWIKEGPGVGRALAEWMTHAESEIDLHASDVARFHEHHKTRTHVKARVSEAFNKTYGIVHPLEQWASNRGVRLSPFHERERELGAVFFEAAGWERPQWYESNAPLLEEFGDLVGEREAEWDGRWWSPIINAEHLAMRERAAMFDLSAFCIFDVCGPCALDALQKVSMRQMDVPVGKVVYTPWLSPEGGFKSDLTVMRLGDEHFRVVTGGAHGMADRKWLAAHLREDGSAQLADLTSAWTTLGLWGPRARGVLAALTSDDVSNEGFPFATCRVLELGPLRVLASRISYVGDLGWELYVPLEQGARLWDLVWEAGEAHGVVPAGIGVYGTTGRLEKCYRAYGTELESEYTAVEAGMAGPRVKDADFVGKAAHLRQREEEPVAVLCTLTVDDHTSSSGVKRFMQGREPVVTRDGTLLLDAKGRRSYVTSAGSGPSLGKHILLAYLPPEHAVVDAELAVEYLGERYPASVAVVGSTPIFDPENARVKGQPSTAPTPTMTPA
jgi:glycine cleavage system aminomethyltransferase T/glycine/D-amino acid oxidase-like deaminating enzyme